MTLGGTLFAAIIAAFAISAIVLRRTHQRDHDGLAERTGKEIDRVLEKAERQIEMASRKIHRAAKDARR